jgi:hypothetical protein
MKGKHFKLIFQYISNYISTLTKFCFPKHFSPLITSIQNKGTQQLVVWIKDTRALVIVNFMMSNLLLICNWYSILLQTCKCNCSCTCKCICNCTSNCACNCTCNYTCNCTRNCNCKFITDLAYAFGPLLTSELKSVIALYILYDYDAFTEIR